MALQAALLASATVNGLVCCPTRTSMSNGCIAWWIQPEEPTTRITFPCEGDQVVGRCQTWFRRCPLLIGEVLGLERVHAWPWQKGTADQGTERWQQGRYQHHVVLCRCLCVGLEAHEAGSGCGLDGNVTGVGRPARLGSLGARSVRCLFWDTGQGLSAHVERRAPGPAGGAVQALRPAPWHSHLLPAQSIESRVALPKDQGFFFGVPARRKGGKWVIVMYCVRNRSRCLSLEGMDA